MSLGDPEIKRRHRACHGAFESGIDDIHLMIAEKAHLPLEAECMDIEQRP